MLRLSLKMGHERAPRDPRRGHRASRVLDKLISSAKMGSDPGQNHRPFKSKVQGSKWSILYILGDFHKWGYPKCLVYYGRSY